MVVLGITHAESEQEVRGCRAVSSGVQEKICHQVHLHDTERSGRERGSEGKSGWRGKEGGCAFDKAKQRRRVTQMEI